VLATAERPSWFIEVRERGSFRELLFRGKGWEFVHTRAFRSDLLQSGWTYVDGFHLAPLLGPFPSGAGRALFLGGGGALGPSQFARAYPEIDIDVIEIDPDVAEFARAYFGFETGPKVHLLVEDAANFVARSDARYDVVVVDVYDDGNPKLLGASFLSSLRERLAPNGVLCMNITGASKGPHSAPVRTAARAFRDVFGDARRFLFAIPALDENTSLLRAELRRNHLMFAICNADAPSLAELRRRAHASAIPHAPRLAQATRWPVNLDELCER